MRTLHGSLLKTELLVRLFLIIFFFYTDKAPGFVRKIQKEEYWLYNFPRTISYYPSAYLWLTVLFSPLITVWIVYFFTKDKVDAVQSLLGSCLSIFLAGSITNVVKMGVGRPRPDFLARCFPDGDIDDSMICKGNVKDVIDGYKSFPSGHSALSFSCLGFLSLYVAGKLHVFNPTGRGSAWRLMCVIFPLLWATMIAVSRTADYHHHWQDVTVGSILGLTIAYLVYRMYYPSLQRLNSHVPYVSISPADTQIPYIDHRMDTPLTPLSPSHTTDIEQLLKTV
ncbi:phospholipid phosphatase 5-like [Mercenaria mercenaria]|uniref:phospholipid phosphatase 5-like n=1 Tax=Mercenaria mercenaria TaxID=6596 RepID=UPI00234F4EE4|nr:phospholipid phosphatase 5-like [Mercenaria mercenaria]XP_045190427.2 phospholipid phosphatase 5-like [Mercenaria mercenaria]